MSATHLLYWMSARKEGSWQQFRGAVEELHNESANDQDPLPAALPLHQDLFLNLQRFGHAEFFSEATARRWRVTKPILAVNKQHGIHCGILIGARSKKMVERLLAIEDPKLATMEVRNCPSQITVDAASIEELRRVLEPCGVTVQEDTSKLLLLCTDRIDTRSSLIRSDLPVGREWTVETFLPTELMWQTIERREANRLRTGLLQFGLRHERRTLFIDRGIPYEVPTQIGKFLLLKRRRRRVIQYDAATQLLAIPASCRVPFLIERALLTSSRELPVYERRGKIGMLTYSRIPADIAFLAADLLCQSIP